MASIRFSKIGLIFLPAILLFAPRPLAAIEEACLSGLVTFGDYQFDVTIASPNLTVTQRDEMLSTIEGANNFVAGTLKTPKVQQVVLSDKGRTHQCEPGLRLVIPYQGAWTIEIRPDTIKEFTKHPVYTKVAIVHEQGHAIFDLNMKDRIPGWSEHIAKAQKVWEAREELTQAMLAKIDIEDSLEKEGKTDVWRTSLRDYEVLMRDRRADGSYNGTLPERFSDPRFVKWLEAKQQEDALWKKLSELEPEDVISLSLYAAPLTELFSDSFTVLYYGKGDVVHKSIVYSGMPKKKFIEWIDGKPHVVDRDDTRMGRDFTANYKAENWQLSEEHSLYGPTRAYLWKHYFSNPAYKDKKPQMLAKLLDVISDEIQAHKEGTPREKNERLIATIEQRFQEL